MQRLNKEYKIDICRYINVSYGSTNKQNPKVIYVNGKCWISAVDDGDYAIIMQDVKRELRDEIAVVLANGNLFERRFILDFDINCNDFSKGESRFLSFDFFIKQRGESKTLEDLEAIMSRRLSTVVNGFVYILSQHGLSPRINKKNK